MCEITTFSANYKDNALKLNLTSWLYVGESATFALERSGLCALSLGNVVLVDCGGTVVRSVCVYVWVAFAVKEKGKWCAPPSCAPIVYGEILPQRGKKSQKSEWFSFLVFEMLSLLAKILDCDDFCVLASKNKREKSLCEGNESHACVSRAYQQRFNFFAVTSVTQGGKRWRKRWRNPVRGKDEKSVFRCCDTLMLSDWTAYLLKSVPDVAVIYWKIGI